MSRPLLALLPALCAPALLHAEATTAAQAEFFEKSIRPVLVKQCYDCHSSAAGKAKGGLVLDTREGIRRGGDTGPAVVPGNPAKSLLLSAIHYTDKDLQMPPQKAGGKLPDNVIAAFEQWIKAGAPDPRDGAAKTVAQINKEAASSFWSFKPPQKHTPPAVKDTTWPKTDVDRFVLAAMEQKAVTPVPDTEPRALLRRLYFDLIGMPPTTAQMNQFITAWNQGPAVRQKTLEAVVDVLLRSRQFGERWGRHWLDVARYAESAGKESNNLFPTAWRYRDYVIDAFTDGKPYDEFIREQIAGDLLPAKDAADRNENLTATAFLAIGTKNIVEKNKLLFQMDLIDEQIDTTSRAVMGITVACARCHDHKYDPITMQDYYGMAGIFRSTDTLYGTLGRKNRAQNASTLMPLADETKPLSAQAVPAPEPGVRPANAPMRPLLRKNAALAAAGKNAPQVGKKKAAQQAAAAAVRAAAPTPQELRNMVMGVRDGTVVDCPIYAKGEVDSPGPKAQRGVLSLLGDRVNMPANSSGRLQLAQWLTSRQNPLTARVMVNRIWQHLFGQGLVRTADNFGATGERPSHPELLDYLAVRFMDQGWSVKQVIREIVLSRVYALSTRTDDSNSAIDPGNTLLWRANPRRLDAEAIRDALLVASGLMDFNPPGGSMVGSIGDGFARAYSDRFVEAQFHYRSVYLPIVRDFVPSCLEVFDFAEPSLVVPSREASNVPSQALYMMNNPFVIEQAKALARRISAVPGVDYLGRIGLAYEHALGRPPTDAERQRADEFLRAQYGEFVSLKSGTVPAAAEDAYATFCQALFASAEFRFLADSLPNQSTVKP